jgi:sensor histidine kinase YesM
MKTNKTTVKEGSLDQLQARYEAHWEKKEYKKAYFTLKKIAAINERVFEQEKKGKLVELEKEFHLKQKDELLAQERMFNETLKEKNEELTRVLNTQKSTELHLKSLQLQLSPHFIFNTLQSIQSFIFQQDGETTGDYIAQFAKLMRAILNASEKEKVSVKEEVELLETYMYLEQRRFERIFSYDIQLRQIENHNLVFLPSLLLQPFVENAILHGVGNQKDGKIAVVFRYYKQYLYIHILDNGIGRTAAGKIHKRTYQGTSTALKIMLERAELSRESELFEFHFRIQDRKKNRKIVGTQVSIQVKYLK